MTLPPAGPTLDGDAVTATVLTAATPTVMVTWLLGHAVVVELEDPPEPVAPPDTALTTAAPDAAPALNVATARPLVV